VSQINNEREDVSWRLLMTGQPWLKEMLCRWWDEGKLKVNKGINFKFALNM
jgi:hypothetical protein